MASPLRLPAAMRLLALGAVGAVVASLAAAAPPSVSPAEAHAIATDAYVYGYPLVTMEMRHRAKAAMLVPEADTLAAAAWLDLSAEPYVLSIPDMKGRYFLMPVVDGWTNVVTSIGSRTTGTKEQKYVITGPHYKGGWLPLGAKRVESPTDVVWIPGRIHAAGTAKDVEAARALKDRFSLVPLSAYGTPHASSTALVDAPVAWPVRDQVDALDAATFFGMLTELMARNPPAAKDRPILDRMAKIGMVPGGAFDRASLSPEMTRAIESVPAEGRNRIVREADSAPRMVNDWQVFVDPRHDGTDYLRRAAAAATALDADRPEDVVYAIAGNDAAGLRLDGSQEYVLHLDVRSLPPAYGFWSLTLYDEEMRLPYNPWNRHAINQETRLLASQDGTLDLLVQHDSPGPDRENWLPSPEGRFFLVLRLFWPTETPPSILDGSWKPPPVTRASEVPRAH
jgi:hypothetical protein